MADPTKFVPGFDYSDFEQSNPTLPKPGAQLDNDFENIKQTTDQTIDALKQIRRSDGKLKNGIVTADSLSPGLIIGIETPQAWQTGVTYSPPDAVFISSGVNQGIYRATVIHTSTTFAADLAAGKWELIFNLTAAGLSTVALTGQYADLLNKPFTVPAGGTTGQTLIKTSNVNGAYAWQNPPGGGDMLASVYDPQGIADDAFDRANHTGEQAIGTIIGLVDALNDRATDVELATAITSILGDAWALQPLGSLIPANIGMPGFVFPPKDKAYRYVLLTAGQTGAGAYNQGILTSESTSGSHPTVTSTAVVSLAGSPFNGNTIRLINTERRFLRPGFAGTLEDSQNLAHTHGVTDGGHAHSVNYQAGPSGTIYAGGQLAGVSSLVGPVAFNTQPAATGVSIQSSGGNEARPRNVGVDYLMRIL